MRTLIPAPIRRSFKRLSKALQPTRECNAPKIVGVGMSKTGTKTLGACFQILGLTPSCSWRDDLKRLVWENHRLNPIGEFPYSYDPSDLGLSRASRDQIMKVARRYRSFEDTPWYMLFRELDEEFPGSRFILTIRKDSRTRSVSNWWHNVRAGTCAGPPDPAFIEHDMAMYEAHNSAVRTYFANRPGQLLTVCWELGDDWNTICRFLGVDQPVESFPHENSGRYS